MKRFFLFAWLGLLVPACSLPTEPALEEEQVEEPPIPPNFGTITFRVTNANAADCAPYVFTFQVDGQTPVMNGERVQNGVVFMFYLTGLGPIAPPRFEVSSPGKHEVSFIRWNGTIPHGSSRANVAVELGGATTIDITCPNPP